MNRYRFPEPDPDMKPLPPDFNERVMRELRRRQLARVGVRVLGATLAACILAFIYLHYRPLAPQPPQHGTSTARERAPVNRK